MGQKCGALLDSLASLCQTALEQGLPEASAQVICAATLIHLQKTDGGVRPIAIGDTLRRLIGKVATRAPTIKPHIHELQPLQCGVGVKNACEHMGIRLQQLITTLPANGTWVVAQVDFANAFNTMACSSVLASCHQCIPALYRWMHFCYHQTVPLMCQNRIVSSATGVHHGDPLGPLGFALGIHEILEGLNSFHLHWHTFYVDDGLLVGNLDEV